MRLKDFRVKAFRNFVDSGTVNVDQKVTCLVGKNEAGKSAMLEALYLLNPAYEATLDTNGQYPRWLLAKDRRNATVADAVPIQATFLLEEGDKAAIDDLLGPGVLTKDDVSVSRRYSGEISWSISFDERSAVKNAIEAMGPLVAPRVSDISGIELLRSTLEEISTEDITSLHGIHPSPEEVESAKAILSERGLAKGSVLDVVADVLKQRLPIFFRFTEYNLLPGRIDLTDLESGDTALPASSGSQTMKALLLLAGTDSARLGEENYELRTGELEAVQIDLTNQVFEYWKQNPDLQVKIDVDKETVTTPQGQQAVARYLDIRLEDKRTGYSNNFDQRSAGFKWFFSFLAAFSEFENHERGVVVLLDEPALTLHGRAQADFLRFIDERLAPKAQVLYTTHSPFMIETDHLERVRLVEDPGPPEGATATEGVLATDPDSLFPLQAALGYDIAQSLFVGPNNLIIEGTSDFTYLTVLSSALSETGRGSLDERWRVLPAGGATNIPTFVALIGPHLDVTVLADGNAKGMQRINEMVAARGLLKPSRLILISQVVPNGNADIEDLFSEGDYLKLFNGAFNSDIKVKHLPPGDRITKRLAKLRGSDFDHGLPADWLLRNRTGMTFTDSSLERFEKLFALINATSSDLTADQ